MTNKYSELSDQKINELVAIKFGFYFSIVGFDAEKDKAFQLMIDNKMSIQPIISTNKWHVIGDFIINKDGSGGCISATHKNPCRAIAECFLLVKDAENNNDR